MRVREMTGLIASYGELDGVDAAVTFARSGVSRTGSERGGLARAEPTCGGAAEAGAERTGVGWVGLGSLTGRGGSRDIRALVSSEGLALPPSFCSKSCTKDIVEAIGVSSVVLPPLEPPIFWATGRLTSSLVPSVLVPSFSNLALAFLTAPARADSLPGTTEDPSESLGDMYLDAAACGVCRAAANEAAMAEGDCRRGARPADAGSGPDVAGLPTVAGRLEVDDVVIWLPPVFWRLNGLRDNGCCAFVRGRCFDEGGVPALYPATSAPLLVAEGFTTGLDLLVGCAKADSAPKRAASRMLFWASVRCWLTEELDGLARVIDPLGAGKGS